MFHVTFHETEFHNEYKQTSPSEFPGGGFGLGHVSLSNKQTQHFIDNQKSQVWPMYQSDQNSKKYQNPHIH